MRKLNAFILILFLVHASDGFAADPQAKQVKTNVSAFAGNLSSSDDTVQKALDTLDDITGGVNDATYITQTANGTLTNEQALASLATGILKNTTTTGVLSIAAAGTDYLASDDFTSSTTFKIPNSTNPTVNASGKIAQDTTADQLVYGSTPRVLNYKISKCGNLREVGASSDNLFLSSFPDPTTYVAFRCRCYGTCTTKATFTLKDDSSNSFTMSPSPVCGTAGSDGTTGVITSGGSLSANKSVLVSTSNSPVPETDNYEACLDAIATRQ